MHSHHDHDHHHHHQADALDFSNLNLSFIIAVAANLGFTIIEAVYAFIADSVSLLGDAGHNLSDVLGLLLAWGAAYLATRATSESYSYGFRRTTILAALVNAVVLVGAALYIAWESMARLLQPQPVAEVTIMIVAALGIVVNAGSALLFMKGSKDDLNVRGAFLHLAYDAVISAAVVLGAALIWMTGWLWIDPLLGLLITVIIIAGTWGLLRDSVNLILDAVPQGVDRAAVQTYLLDITGVTQVHDLHIWAMSTQENCLTAHLVMPENTLWEAEDGYARIGRSLRENFNIHHVTLQVEKDLECQTQDCD